MALQPMYRSGDAPASGLKGAMGGPMEQTAGSTTWSVRGGLTDADDTSCSAHCAGTCSAAGGPINARGVRAFQPAGPSHHV